MNVLNKKKYLPLWTLGLLMSGTAVSFIIACTQQAKAKLNILYVTPPKPGVAALLTLKDGTVKEISEETLIGPDQTEFFELKKKE